MFGKQLFFFKENNLYVSKKFIVFNILEISQF